MNTLFEISDYTKPNDWDIYKCDFQTPVAIARYMASLIPEGAQTVLEPTPGKGNIVDQISAYDVTAPLDFFLLDKNRFDCIIMNPPFAAKYANMKNAPAEIKQSGMKLGYYVLFECMKMSKHIIALMPWFTITDSDVRLRFIKEFGLRSVTALPRKTFEYARIQTCVLELEKGFTGKTEFKVFDLL